VEEASKTGRNREGRFELMINRPNSSYTSYNIE